MAGGDKSYVIGIDIGTTYIRSSVFSRNGTAVGTHSEKLRLVHTSQRGLEEIAPNSLWQQFVSVVKESITRSGLLPSQIQGIGLSTQRNTFITWDSQTGKPLQNFVSWRDVRASEYVDSWNSSARMLALNSFGRVLYYLTRSRRFLGAAIYKIVLVMVIGRLLYAISQNEQLAAAIGQRRVHYGCIETYLLYRLTGGRHLTESSCASATGMWDPFQKSWGDAIINLFGIPSHILPSVEATCSDAFGSTEPDLFGAPIKIAAVIGDASASLFGCGCFHKGSLKITQGTGTFMDLNTGSTPHNTITGLVPIVGWHLKDDEYVFAATAYSYDTGTSVDWAVSIGLLNDPGESEEIALSVADTDGVYFVPAFGGMQVPINDPSACASFIGLKQSTTRAHLVRALLESLAYRAYQLFEVFHGEIDTAIGPIRCDGGVSANNFVCQSMADLIGQPVERIENREASCFGAAALAGLATGFWKNYDEIETMIKVDQTFVPREPEGAAMRESYKGWLRAVGRSLKWYR